MIIYLIPHLFLLLALSLLSAFLNHTEVLDHELNLFLVRLSGRRIYLVDLAHHLDCPRVPQFLHPVNHFMLPPELWWYLSRQ